MRKIWTYDQLVTKLSKKYKRAKLTIVVKNLEDKSKCTIVNNAKSSLDTFELIYDPSRKSNMMKYPDAFYCVTFEELKDSLLFILKRSKALLSNTKNDILEKNIEDIISLEEILEQIEDEQIEDIKELN